MSLKGTESKLQLVQQSLKELELKNQILSKNHDMMKQTLKKSQWKDSSRDYAKLLKNLKEKVLSSL